MKKNIIAVILLLLVLSLTGCKKSNFGVVTDSASAKIIAENASKDMFGAAASFEIADGQKLYVEPALTKGEVSVKIKSINLDIDAAVDDLKDAVSGTDSDLEFRISGTTPEEYELAPGSYSVYASVLSKADGTIQMTVR